MTDTDHNAIDPETQDQQDRGPPPELSRDLAYRAYTNISQFPERKAAQDIQQFHDALKAFEDKLLSLAKTPEQQALIPAQVERYRAKYIQHQHGIWYAKSNIASAFIFGPARFPAAKMEKRNRRLHNREVEFLSWMERAEQSAAKTIMGARTTDDQMANDDWKRLQRYLAQDIGVIKGIDAGTKPYHRQAFTTSMAGRIERAANNGRTELVKLALDFIREQQKDMAQPIFTDRHSVWKLLQSAENTNAARPAGMKK